MSVIAEELELLLLEICPYLSNIHHLLGVVLQSSGENLDLEENVGAGPGSGHVVVMVMLLSLQLH